MRLIADKAATVRKCWPGRDFTAGAPVLREPWLESLLGAESGPVAWGVDQGGCLWDQCLVVARAADSQYDQLRRLEPSVVSSSGNLACLALTGDGFHGQLGRKWQTEAGNFHLSLKVDLDLPAAEFSRSLVMLPAVVVLDALISLGQPVPQVGIKWVNDIWMAGLKIGGVLTAARSEGGRLISVVFGVGLNVAQIPNTPSSAVHPGATSLQQHLGQGAPDLGPLLDLFLSCFETRFAELVREGPTPVLEQYRHHSLVLDRVVALWPDGPEAPEPGQVPRHQGKCLEILPDLSLLLEGVNQPVTEGRLGFLS